jgi:elongation factor P--beta-lysine ligase
MTDLLKSLGFTSPAVQLSYAQAFSEFANIDILKTLHRHTYTSQIEMPLAPVL